MSLSEKREMDEVVIGATGSGKSNITAEVIAGRKQNGARLYVVDGSLPGAGRSKKKGLVKLETRKHNTRYVVCKEKRKGR